MGEAKPKDEGSVAAPSFETDWLIDQDTSDVHPARTEVDRIVERIAESDMSVLITGETGVGKERLAEILFRFSRRASAPFIRIACGAFPDSLIESEMFGYESGAFTNADRSKPGLLETAQGGTVFLDEVGELSARAQVKLLRLLDERRVRRIGALTQTKLDVRFISATNRDLLTQIKNGTFRQDLYFRLSGVTLNIPPLRERAAEIGSLARTFIAHASVRNGWKNVPSLSMGALRALEVHDWPGNVRELKNIIERAALLAGGGTILEAHLPLDHFGRASDATSGMTVHKHDDEDLVQTSTLSPIETDTGAPPSERIEDFYGPAPERTPSIRRRSGIFDGPEDRVREEILGALAAAGGNQTQAAEALGVSRRTLINRLDAYGIPRPRKRTSSEDF